MHLGFLQINHRYSILFSVPRAICQTSKSSQASFVESATPNINLNVISITSKDNESIDFQLTLLAHKEKLLKEVFFFQLSDKKSPIKVILNCRVLGEYDVIILTVQCKYYIYRKAIIHNVFKNILYRVRKREDRQDVRWEKKALKLKK